MTAFLEKWTVLEVHHSLRPEWVRYDVVDAAGNDVCTAFGDLGLAREGYAHARRIAACVNAMRGLETERIERMCMENPPNWWLPVYEGDEAGAAPERVIEYEVQGHPGHPGMAGLDEPIAQTMQMTHKQAAVRHAQGYPSAADLDAVAAEARIKEATAPW